MGAHGANAARQFATVIQTRAVSAQLALIEVEELRHAIWVLGVVGIQDGDRVQGGELQELLGRSVVGKKAAVEGELGYLAFEEADLFLCVRTF